MEDGTINLYLFVGIVIFVAVTLRTLIIGGFFYSYLYIFKKNKFQTKKLNPDYPKQETIKKEFRLSMLTGINFVIWDLLAFHFFWTGKTLIYVDINHYPLIYIPISLLLLMIVHDFYFYWTHVYMHSSHGKWIKHSEHHQFVNPTPWSAFSVSLIEGCVQMFFHFIVIFIIPLHPLTIGLYFITSFVSNAIGHSGHRIGKDETNFFSNSTNHYLHHRHGRCHYGLYFVWWDKLMKTEHKNVKKKNKTPSLIGNL